MLTLVLDKDYMLVEFKNKSYAGRVFKLYGTSLVFEIHPNYGIRFWSTGRGCVFCKTDLVLINKAFNALEKEVK